MGKFLLPAGIFITILISLKFFEARFLGDTIGITLPIMFATILIGISLTYFTSCKGKFVRPVQLLTIAYLFSIIAAYIAWDQKVIDSMMRTMPLAVIAYFFLFQRLQIKIQTLENIAIIYGYLYFCLNLWQILNPNTAYFGHALVNELGEYEERRGVVRVIFPGAGIFWLASLISINKVLSKNENKLIHVPLTLMGLVLPVIQATRQMIAYVTILYALHFSINLSIAKKIAISIIVVFVGLYIVSLELSVFEGMADKQKENQAQGTKYIRIITGTYYLTEFSDTMFTKLFGNGFPNEKSVYGTVTARLQDRQMFLEDVGIIGLYSQCGLLSVIAWIIIWYKSFTIKLPKEYRYCKYYLWLLLFTSLTSGSIYNLHYAISTTIVIYIYNQVQIERRAFLIGILKKYIRENISSIKLRLSQQQINQSSLIPKNLDEAEDYQTLKL